MGFGSADDLPSSLRDIGAPWNDAIKGLESGRNLVLVGDVGTGKTTFIKCLVRDLISASIPVRGGYVPQLMSSLKNISDLGEIMASLDYGKILVLDDLDKMLGTVYEIEKLSSMVNLCMQKRRPVVVSTNLGFQDLRRMLCSSKYGVPENWVDSFLSRLKHNAQIVTFKGRDMRSPGTISSIEV